MKKNKGAVRRLSKQTTIGLSIIAAMTVAVIAVVGLLVDRDRRIASEAVASNSRFTPSPAATTANPVITPSPAAKPLLVKRPAEGPMRVLFAGDSLTGSYFASDEAKGFRPLLVSSLSKKGEVEPVGVGVPHGRLSEVEAGTQIPSAHLAIVEVGTNDFGKTKIPEFRKQYDSLLDRIEKASPDVAFLCTGIWRGGSEVNAGIRGDEYDKAIQASCEKRGGRYVPLYPIYDNTKMRGPEGVETWIGTSDTFHPNDAGHAAISKAIAAAIRVS